MASALGTLVAPVLDVFSSWFLFEPFVILLSMVPTLLVHDYIFASKLAYGLRVPFGNGFLWRWATPKRGDVLVFKYPLNLDVYYIKRAIGLPGDKIRLQAGVIFVNGTPLPTKTLTDVLADSDLEAFHYFSESPSGYKVRYLDPDLAEYREISVPSGYLFMMGTIGINRVTHEFGVFAKMLGEPLLFDSLAMKHL